MRIVNRTKTWLALHSAKHVSLNLWEIYEYFLTYFSLCRVYQIIPMCYNLYHYRKSDIHKVANTQSKKEKK